MGQYTLPASTFLFYAEQLIGGRGRMSEGRYHMHYIANFGISVFMSRKVWKRIMKNNDGKLEKQASPKHLLWALLFVNNYGKEATTKSIIRHDEKTIRKWVWYFMKEIAALHPHVIKWENRLVGSNPRFRCRVTVDGTDFRYRSQKKMYSFKFNANGLRYEVACSIATGWIVWINGPFPANNHDITIFRDGLRQCLDEDEMVEADGGYRGEAMYISTPQVGDSLEIRLGKQHVRSCQEMVNERIKNFDALYQNFRHSIEKHQIVFQAVCVLVQLSMYYQERTIWQCGDDYVGNQMDYILPKSEF